ncbi:hypothetical protein DV515_00019908, partial [Chloebia gouldiae]
MVRGNRYKTIRWRFLESLEPPRVVHVRCEGILNRGNLYGQVTVRMHSRQHEQSPFSQLFLEIHIWVIQHEQSPFSQPFLEIHIWVIQDEQSPFSQFILEIHIWVIQHEQSPFYQFILESHIWVIQHEQAPFPSLSWK